tara:strand:- start:393 stop:755 length:363 start_codon:yes stop_codon:yes gene_type:complete
LSVVYAVVVVAAWPSTRVVVVVVHASRRDHRAIDDVGRFCAVVALRRSPAKREKEGISTSPRARKGLDGEEDEDEEDPSARWRNVHRVSHASSASPVQSNYYNNDNRRRRVLEGECFWCF